MPRWIAVLAAVTVLGGCTDPVGPGGVVRIEFFGAPDTLVVGDSVPLIAAAFKDDYSIVHGVELVWSSSDPSIASVDQAGRVVARSAGATRIIASAGPISTTLSLAVVPFHNITSCSGTGVSHSGSIASAVWHARHNPHWLTATVTVDSLVLEPGVVVCASPDVQLNTRVFLANGTAARPIRLLSADGTSKWRGVLVTERGGAGDIRGGNGQISHAFVELGNLSSGFYAGLSIRDTHLRQGSAGYASIHRTIVDTGRVFIRGGGVFENTIIRGGSLRLDYFKHGFFNGPITINGGRIEDSPGMALEIGSLFQPGIPDIDVVNSIRIVGSRGGIGRIPAASFVKLWPTRESQDSLLGNADPTLELWGLAPVLNGGLDVAEIYMRRELRFRVFGYSGALSVGAATIERGTSIELPGNFIIRGPVTLVGSDTTHVQIATTDERCGQGSQVCGLWLRGNAVSELSYMTFDNAYLDVGDEHRVRAGHINVRNNERSGIFIRTSGFHLSDCDVTDNAGNGIEILAGTSIEIHDCNIERNGGFGVDNRTMARVDARGNWWGDPAGPFGPAGDGTSGNVDSADFRIAPLR